MLVRESGFAIQVHRTCTSSGEVLFNVRALLQLVRESECSGAGSVLKVRALLPLVRESELVLARTKKGHYVCLKNYL